MRSVANRIVLAAVAAALAVAASGCGKSSSPTSPPPAMSQANADDIAIQAASSVQVANLDLVAGASGSGSALVSRPGATNSSAQWDTTFSIGNLTFEATREFYDAANGLLPGYGPTAVRMVWTSRVFGTALWPRDTVTVGHSASADFRGIESTADTLLVDGAALDTLTSSFRSYDGTQTRYFYWNSSLTTAGLRYLKSTLGRDAWPLSGTVTLVVQADRLRSNDRADVEAHLNATVVVTFNGTSQPEIVVNGVWHYRWNPGTGIVTRV